jgi:hypothetical protein
MDEKVLRIRLGEYRGNVYHLTVAGEPDTNDIE